MTMNCMCQYTIRTPASIRCFATSATRAASLGLGANDSQVVRDVIPEYPPGPTRWYKQASQGLYGGARIQFGNNTNEKYRHKTRRTWLPNVKTKKLYSQALGQRVQIRVTTRVLRTIDKLGGLDEYLLGEKAARIKELGEAGWWLRWAIMQTDTVKQRFAQQRAALGFSESDLVNMVDPVHGQGVAGEVPTLAIEESADDAEPDEFSLLSAVDTKKSELKFRASRYRYLELRDGRWQPIVSERVHLIKALRKLSPTALLRRWDNEERKRLESVEGALPATEKVRGKWFAARRLEYDILKKKLAKVKPHESHQSEVLSSEVSDDMVDNMEALELKQDDMTSSDAVSDSDTENSKQDFEELAAELPRRLDEQEASMTNIQNEDARRRS